MTASNNDHARPSEILFDRVEESSTVALIERTG
jgi:hypothetical protein